LQPVSRLSGKPKQVRLLLAGLRLKKIPRIILVVAQSQPPSAIANPIAERRCEYARADSAGCVIGYATGLR
jgi:hypothetical protein